MDAGLQPLATVAPAANRLGAAAATADGLLEERSTSVTRRLSGRELRAELFAALAFAGVAGAMLLALPDDTALDPVEATLLVAMYALLGRVTFQLGPGFVRPTQLAFVPMLFLLPAAAVPLLVAAGAVSGELPEILRGRARAERVVVAAGNSWYSVGPALVFALIGPSEPSATAWSVYLLALSAQFGVDTMASTLREWLGAGVPPAAFGQVLGLVYLVDALLAPIGLLAVLATTAQPYAYLLAVPAGALFSLIARERSKRIDRLCRQAAQLQRAHRRVGEAVTSTLDRGALERLLLTTTVEAVEATCGRLSSHRHGGSPTERLVAGGLDGCTAALFAAEAALLADPGAGQVTVDGAAALAVPLGGARAPGDRRRPSDTLAVARIGPAFSGAERELLEHLAAQAAVSLENLELHELIQRQATTDELTGLLNHRRLQQLLAESLAEAERTGEPVALLMLDIDDFKRVNDTHGHQQGDCILREVARVLRAASRAPDHAGRYGGEELGIVLPRTTLDEAMVVAERVREAVAGLALAVADGEVLRVTVSTGVAVAPGCGHDRVSLIEAADAALYDAKRAGKNRCVRAPATAAPRQRRFAPSLR